MEVFALILILGLGVFYLQRSNSSAVDVALRLSALRDEAEEETDTRQTSISTAFSRASKQQQEDDDYFQAGLFKREERIRFERWIQRWPLFMGIMVSLCVFLVTQNLLYACVGFMGGLCGTYLYLRRTLYRRRKKLLSDIDFFLPVVMERLVMTAQAGLDVFSGIRVVCELAHAEEREFKDEMDPVTALLERVRHLIERGVGFEEALSQVSRKIESPALRHAFIHLAVAQKDGGELVNPLRELSDSTQAYFQETIEEQIAKLPVKATMPLMLTFAGLVIFFMTSPMVQVMKMSAEGLAK